MSAQSSSAPFSKAVVNAMRRLYPESLADKSFDNTGLLLEAPFDGIRRQMNSLLLTVDLTQAVADEAIARNDSIIIAYHPIIFRGLKSLTLSNSQQRSLLRLAAEGISVYSPHTAIDAAPGGLGDWLADIVTGNPTDYDPNSEEEDASPSDQTQDQGHDRLVPDNASIKSKAPSKAESDGAPDQKRPTYTLQHHPSQLSLHDKALELSATNHKRQPITPSTVKGYETPGAGMGRVVTFSSPQPLVSIIDRIGLGLGNPKGFPIAIPQGKEMSEINISTVAICAGSGGGVFSGLGRNGVPDADLLFTGELGHHETLAAIESGKCVIALFHSNTERGFLHSVLKPQLEATVREEWDKLRRAEGKEAKEKGWAEDYLEALGDDHVEVTVSEVDRDPYGIMISKDEV